MSNLLTISSKSGLYGKTKTLISFFSTDQTQLVLIDGYVYNPKYDSTVPWLCVKPLLFKICVMPLSGSVRALKLNYHIYAHDVHFPLFWSVICPMTDFIVLHGFSIRFTASSLPLNRKPEDLLLANTR